MTKGRQVYPCKCKNYNQEQCYNCLNGAHDICESRRGCKTARRGIGLTMVFIAADEAKRNETK